MQVIDECSICLIQMTKGNNLFITSCGHTFHFECIKQVLEKTNAVCPLCRADQQQLNSLFNIHKSTTTSISSNSVTHVTPPSGSIHRSVYSYGPSNVQSQTKNVEENNGSWTSNLMHQMIFDGMETNHNLYAREASPIITNTVCTFCHTEGHLQNTCLRLAKIRNLGSKILL